MTAPGNLDTPAADQTTHARAVRPRGRWLLWAAVAVALAASAGLITAGLNRGSGSGAAQAAPESYGSAPSYQLTDQNGQPVSSRQFAGKVQVVSYLFPYCTTYCPLLARDMAVLAGTVSHGPLRGKVQLVTFNVDPAGAGPKQLRAFMRQYGANPADPTWRYLTGTPTDINRVVTGGFHVYFSKTSVAAENAAIAREKANGTYIPQPQQPNALADRAHVDYDVVHNNYLEIVNPRGEIVALFDQASSLSQADILTAIHDALAGRPIPPQQAP